MKCCQYKPGEMNRRIDVEEKQQTGTGPTGNPITEWALVFRPWCKIKPITGRERIFAQGVNAIGMVQVICRWRAGLTESMRVIYRGEEYNVRSIINIEEADEWMEIMIERGVVG